jgi:ubiquinone/menaquinone biosynthesis C-methylase UbiE
VGLDISTVNLTIAKRRNQELILVCADAENTPFQEKCFDIVLIVDLLHHVPVPANVIKECSRILKKTGQVFIFDACRDGVKPISPVAMFVEWLSKRWGNKIETLGPSLSELSSWLDSYKLHVLKRFGEGTFVRYINSMASSLLGKFGMPLPHKVQRIFSSFDKKLQICSKKFPIKIGIMAIKRMNT